MIFLKILFFFLLAAIVSIAIVILVLTSKVKQLADRFKQQASQRPRYQNDASSDNGEPTVVDRRKPEEASQKIIPADEGEYIDYTEER